MKNKKGFTLIEVLGVIVVLGLLALIVVPSVDSIVKKSKQKAYDNQIEAIRTGLKHWVADNKSNLLDNSITIKLTLANLKSAGYIDYEFINPKTNKPFSNDSTFTIIIEDGKFKYEVNSVLDGTSTDTQTITCSTSSETFNFSYTGSSQIFTPSCPGSYKLEVWGARGGQSMHSTSLANIGGYSIGTIILSADTILYVYVGGAGIGSADNYASTRVGGYNGGGYVNMTESKDDSATGGGASDIRIGGISLYNRVIVAGGGGGNGCSGDIGGVGGGASGVQGYAESGYGEGGGAGTQTSGGKAGQCTAATNCYESVKSSALPGVFGKGGDSPSTYPWASGAGGGGWYGGGAGSAVEGGGVSGGGGSGWVYTESTFNNWSNAVGKSESDKFKLDSKYYLTSANIYKSGDSGFVVNSVPASTGHGFVKITYLGP